MKKCNHRGENIQEESKYIVSFIDRPCDFYVDLICNGCDKVVYRSINGITVNRLTLEGF